MPLDGLPLPIRYLAGLFVPPLLTIVCWLAGQRMAGIRRVKINMWRQPGFWALLLAAYVFFSLALAGGRLFNQAGRADPSSRLVQ